MRRFYKLHNANEEDNEDAYGASTSKAPDYARGQLLMESSDEDEFRVKPSKALASDELDSEEDLPEEVKLGPESSHLKPSVAPKTFGEEDEDEMPEVNLDESEFAGLEAQATAYSKSDTAQEEAKRSNVAAGDETSRLAIVNLDWDHVRSHHLFKIFYSIIAVDPASSTRHPAKVARVRVYPSEFGKERIAREEKEGPPPELFKRKDEDSEEDVGAETIYEIGDADKGDYDDEALRKYQLERLRCVQCSLTGLSGVTSTPPKDTTMPSRSLTLPLLLISFTLGWMAQSWGGLPTFSTSVMFQKTWDLMTTSGKPGHHVP